MSKNSPYLPGLRIALDGFDNGNGAPMNLCPRCASPLTGFGECVSCMTGRTDAKEQRRAEDLALAEKVKAVCAKQAAHRGMVTLAEEILNLDVTSLLEA